MHVRMREHRCSSAYEQPVIYLYIYIITADVTLPPRFSVFFRKAKGGIPFSSQKNLMFPGRLIVFLRCSSGRLFIHR